MHRIIRWMMCRLVVFLLLISSGIPPAAADEEQFPDLTYTWFRYREAIDYLAGRDVLSGHPDGTFKPKDYINRAEFLKIVFRGRSDTVPSGGSCFADIPEDAWYAPYVCASVRRGIVKGYPDGLFKPEQPVNMAEAMKMLLLAYGREIEERGGQDWYQPYTDLLDDEGMLARNSYLPWEMLKRERAADLLARFLRADEDRVLLSQSDGCGKREPDSVATTIEVNGLERSFILDIPADYASRTPHPLIVAFHGRTNPNEQVRSYYGLTRNAEDYIVVYPAALSNGNGSFRWNDPSDPRGWAHDVAFFDALVEEIGDNYCVDFDNIYTVGHSLGAWMANTVACIRGDVVKASGTVGGDTLFTDCAGPAAAMIMHNPDDRLSPFSGAEALRDLRLEENVCQPEPRDTEPEEFNCVKYRCDGGNDIVWCPHEQDEDHNGNYYPHNWPRDTGREIVRFFEAL